MLDAIRPDPRLLALLLTAGVVAGTHPAQASPRTPAADEGSDESVGDEEQGDGDDEPKSTEPGANKDAGEGEAGEPAAAGTTDDGKTGTEDGSVVPEGATGGVVPISNRVPKLSVPSAVVPAPPVPEIPTLGAVAEVRAALLRVDALQALLSAEERGDEQDEAWVELAALRRSLEDALVELARLQGRDDLVRWLKAEGLMVVPAEFVQPADGTSVSASPLKQQGDGPQPVSVGELTALIAAIDAFPFTDDRMQALKDWLEGRYLVTEQAGRIVELFKISSDKVDALVFLYPRILDPDKFESLIGSLKFASDRIVVRRELGLKGS